MNRFRQLMVLILVLGLVILLARCTANRITRTGHAEPLAAVPRPDHAGRDLPVPRIDTPESPPPPAGKPQAAPSSTPPEDALPHERILVFPTDEAMEQFLAMLRANGSAELIARQDKLHAIRIRIRDETAYNAALPGMPAPQASSLNFHTRIPPGSDRAAGGGPYVPFNDNVNRILGIPSEHSGWGKGVTVAVLDTGMGIHPMLSAANVTRLNLLPGESSDKSGTHGTAVGSLIVGKSAELDGVAPAAELLSIRVLDDQEPGDSFTLANGLVSAVDAGSRVINISLASSGNSAAVAEAVDYAIEHGVLVVAAAGNDSASELSYPARYPVVVSVGAVDATGRHVDFSNTGSGLTLSAPGVGVAVAAATSEGSGLALYSGTSVAAPIISGLLVRLLAADASLTPAEAVGLLTTYADDTGTPGVDPVYGAGSVNAARVEERGTPGIYDIGIGDFWHTTTPDTVVLSVYVENRGTEPISRADMDIVAAGVPYSINFYSLAPRAIATSEISLHRSQIALDQPIDVVCRLSLPGQTDSRPLDNEVRITLFAVQP